MSQSLILLAVLYCSTYSRAQFVVTQEPSVSVAPGGSVQLSCTRNSGILNTDNYLSWYQQNLGTAPKLLIHQTTSRPSGIPDRFTGSKSGGTAYLTITGVQAGDDSHYHCLMYGGSGTGKWIFGGGTQLSVLSGEIKAPTLSIFPPSTEEIATQKATLVCQCQDFYPAALSWTWTVNGETITTGVGSTRPTKQTDNNLFMAGSLLSIDAIDWNADKKYTCMATHEGKTFQASVKHSECV